MERRKLSDTLSLIPNEQKKVSKKIKSLTKKIKKGKISVRDFKTKKLISEKKVKKRKSSDTLSLIPSEQKIASKKVRGITKKIKKGKTTIKDFKARVIRSEKNRGLIYISHLPHGFYEDELKNYFKQFGKVTNVKVCRSNKTGKSKGYGYVEFAHPEVAKIAGETMNNYLMFKRRLSVNYIPYENRPKHLFHGKRSTETNYSAKNRRLRQHQATVEADEATHNKRLKKRVSRLSKKMEKLGQIGIDLQSNASQSTLITEYSDSELEFKVRSKKKAKNTGSKPPRSPNDSKSSESSTEMHSSTASSLSSQPISKNSRSSLRSSETDSSTSPRTTQKTPKKSRPSVSFSETDSSPSVNIIQPESLKKPKSKKNTGVIKKKKIGSKASINTKSTKLAALDADTVKKIARELIRKKGKSLLTFPKSDKKISKKAK